MHATRALVIQTTFETMFRNVYIESELSGHYTKSKIRKAVLMVPDIYIWGIPYMVYKVPLLIESGSKALAPGQPERT